MKSISKSRYIAGLQCDKHLWLELYRPTKDVITKKAFMFVTLVTGNTVPGVTIGINLITYVLGVKAVIPKEKLGVDRVFQSRATNPIQKALKIPRSQTCPYPLLN